MAEAGRLTVNGTKPTRSIRVVKESERPIEEQGEVALVNRLLDVVRR